MKITKPRDKGKTAHAAKPLKYVLRQNKSKVDAEEKSDSIDAKEVLAFFAGIAIIFTLVSKLFLMLLMNVEEVVYGLTFADESISLTKPLYAVGIFLFVISVALAIWCEKKLDLHGNKFILWMDRHRKATFLIMLAYAVPPFLASVGLLGKEINFNISLVYMLISCLSIIVFQKCTMLARALLFFSCFMLAISFFGAKNNVNKNGDMPVIITLQEGDPIKALRCTISKEGFAVIKDSEQNQRIIHVSKIKEISGG
jgi:hypothetical protein